MDLDWFVLRPSLVYGKGGDSTRLFLRTAALPCLVVLGDGQQAVQPVHISDVVAAIVQCLQTPPTRQTLDLVGPQAMAFEDYLQTMRLAQGRKRTRIIVYVPLRFAQVALWPAQFVSAILQPDNLRMLATAPKASNAQEAAFAQLLGRSPKPIAGHLFFEDVMTKGDAS
jgi:nucleoside-diphosphate-sugar epimerase